MKTSWLTETCFNSRLLRRREDCHGEFCFSCKPRKAIGCRAKLEIFKLDHNLKRERGEWVQTPCWFPKVDETSVSLGNSEDQIRSKFFLFIKSVPSESLGWQFYIISSRMFSTTPWVPTTPESGNVPGTGVEKMMIDKRDKEHVLKRKQQYL